MEDAKFVDFIVQIGIYIIFKNVLFNKILRNDLKQLFSSDLAFLFVLT